MTSSPSRGALRGNAASSRPSRHTTRCGTERIGTSVQIVRWPVRKFARVGRPCSRSARSARTSSRVSSRRRVGGLADDVAEDALELRALPGVALGGGGERVGGGGELLHPLADRLGGGEGVDRLLHAVDELGHAAGEADGEALDVVDGEDALESRWPSSVIVTPTSTRSRPGCQVPAAGPGACRARGAPRRAPSGSRCRRPSRGSARGPRRRS